MTKRKTAAFHGAWLSSSLAPSRPVPAWLTDAERMGLEQAAEADDAARWDAIAQMLETRRVPAAPVIAALKRAVEVWRFESQRYEADPEPAQWQGMLRAIRIPLEMGFIEVDDARRSVEKLPAQVLGVLSAVLFERAGIGWSALFDRMMKQAAQGDHVTDDARLLRDALHDMAESLTGLKAKRGPRLKPVLHRAMRDVHSAIVGTGAMKDVPARALAAEVLIECGLPAPSPESRSHLAEMFRK